MITENNCAHFCFLEIQRETQHTVAEVEHLVHHRSRETLDLGDAVTDFSHHTHVLSRHVCFRSGDLGFNILQ